MTARPVRAPVATHWTLIVSLDGACRKNLTLAFWSSVVCRAGHRQTASQMNGTIKLVNKQPQPINGFVESRGAALVYSGRGMAKKCNEWRRQPCIQHQSRSAGDRPGMSPCSRWSTNRLPITKPAHLTGITSFCQGGRGGRKTEPRAHLAPISIPMPRISSIPALVPWDCWRRIRSREGTPSAHRAIAAVVLRK